MKTITRWIILDLLIAVAEGAVLFTFIFLLKQIYEMTDLFVNEGTTIVTIVEIFCSILPTIMMLTFPMSILLASMMVYGRIAQDNELTALQAAGYTTRQLVLPALLVGALLSGILLWWGHRIAPKGLRLFDSIAATIFQNATTAGIRPGKFNELGNYIIVPNSIDQESRMKNVRMFEHDDQRIATTIASPEGTIVYAPLSNSISLNLTKGSIFQIAGQNRRMSIHFEEFNFSIGISGLLRKLANVSRREYKMTDGALQFAVNLPPSQSDKNMIHWWIRCKIEMARRTALPFACLIMAFLGSLLGIISGRGKRSSCYAMAISIIFIYYILLNFGKNFAETQTLPALVGVWIPNTIGVLIAAYLYYRTARV